MFLIQELLWSFGLCENFDQGRLGNEDRENDSYDPDNIKLLGQGSFF